MPKSLNFSLRQWFVTCGVSVVCQLGKAKLIISEFHYLRIFFSPRFQVGWWGISEKSVPGLGGRGEEAGISQLSGGVFSLLAHLRSVGIWSTFS